MPHDDIQSIPNTNGQRRQHSRIPDNGDNFVQRGCNLSLSGTRLVVKSGTITIEDGDTVYSVGVDERVLTVAGGTQSNVYYDLDAEDVVVQDAAPSRGLQLGTVDEPAGTTTEVNRRRDDAVGALQAEKSRTERLLAGSVPTIQEDTRRRFEYRGESISRIGEDIADWSATDGSLSAETSDVYRGSQSAYTEATNGFVRLRWTFSTPIDLSDSWFSLAVKVNDIQGNDYTDGVLQVWDSNGNRVEFETRLWESDNQWMRKDLHLRYTESGWDPTSIDRFDIRTSSRDYQEILFDSLRAIEQPSQAYATVTLDDSNSEDSAFWDVWSEYDLPATFAVQTGRFDEDGSLASDRAIEMYDEGAEFINHGRQGGGPAWVSRALQTYDEEEYRENMMQGAYDLQRLGIGDGAHIHIYGGGAYDPKTIDIASDYAVHDQYSLPSANVAPTLYSSPFTIQRTNWDTQRGAGTLAEAKQAVDWAVQFGGTVHLGGHTESQTESDWREMAQYLLDADIKVVKVREYVARNHSALR